jgi:hypothetical protein
MLSQSAAKDTFPRAREAGGPADVIPRQEYSARVREVQSRACLSEFINSETAPIEQNSTSNLPWHNSHYHPVPPLHLKPL